eukprot:TRINITY_DN6814_c0_g1_i1.p1 TRINITY_DN6814_c0_g1~~TRINITY_DN6814_c0_g1_i1.p1  ORF type:complete len:576 (-),score=119.55 TRINITY_DN6814_c0_g1_i1:7-1734(-)
MQHSLRSLGVQGRQKIAWGTCRGISIASRPRHRLSSTDSTIRAFSLSSFQSDHKRLGFNSDDIVVTGVGAALANAPHGREEASGTHAGKAFRRDNVDRLLNGENFITSLSPAEHQSMLEKNLPGPSPKKADQAKIDTLVSTITPLRNIDQLVQVAGRLRFDLGSEFSLNPALVSTLDTSYQLAIGAGLLALQDAGLIAHDGESYSLDSHASQNTGVIMGSCYPVIDSVIGELSRYMASRHQGMPAKEVLMQLATMAEGIEDATSRQHALDWLKKQALDSSVGNYEYNRKFLIKVTVLGNTQLAQIIGARGPNTLINAACSSTTQAIGIAEDWLRLTRAERVVVVAGDNVTSPNLLPWVGAGFLVAGAATTKDRAQPFDKDRTGLVLGVGGVGLVLETRSASQKRKASPQARLLGTRFANSAGHGVRMDSDHVAEELGRFLDDLQVRHGLSREALARDMVYLAHETCTNSSPEASCAGAEINALRKVFGEKLLSQIVIASTKGYTGHAMGVAFEEAVAVRALQTGVLPPVPHLHTVDPYLGGIIPFKGGKHNRKYILRFAGGFGSQVALSFYRKCN